MEVGQGVSGPSEMAVLFEISPQSYAQLEELWQLRFEMDFEDQGRRKGKSSSRSKFFPQFRLQLHNFFEPLADHGDEVEEVQQEVSDVSTVVDRAPQNVRCQAEEEDFDEILRQFGWSGSSMVGCGGRGSGRKKGQVKKEIKQEQQVKKEPKQQVKREPGTSSSSQMKALVQVVSSGEEDIYEGAQQEDVLAEVASLGQETQIGRYASRFGFCQHCAVGTGRQDC